MSLHPDPARPLTSREIAKIISGIVNSMAEWCDPVEIEKAFAHIHENADLYRNAWHRIRDASTPT